MPKRRKRDAGLGNIRPKKKYKRIKLSNLNSNSNSKTNDPPSSNLENRNDKEPSSNESVAESVSNSVANSSVAMSEVIMNDSDTSSAVSNYCATGHYHKVCAVALLFEKKYDDLSLGMDKNSWMGRHGIISKIKQDLGLKVWSRADFAPIFRHVIECTRTGIPFQVKDVTKYKGRTPKISIKSASAQIIADCIESGLSVKRACYQLNEHLFENNEETVSESAVYHLIKTLKPQVNVVKKRKQGSTDPSHKWSRIRYGFCKQLLARFGVKQFPNDRPCFNRSVAGPLEVSQVVWWDETHRKCLVGGLSSSKEFVLKFKRNSEGKLDADNGEYSKEECRKLDCKYEQEGRFGLGCAVIEQQKQDGSWFERGMKCKLFDYSGKTLISLKDYEAKKNQEFLRIRSLSTKSAVWISNPRQPGTIYECDALTVLNKIGKKRRIVSKTRHQDYQGFETINR